MAEKLFKTITSDDWKRSLKAARERRAQQEKARKEFILAKAKELGLK